MERRTSPGVVSAFATRSSTRRPTISSASSSTVWSSEVLRVATISPLAHDRQTESVIAMNLACSLWVMRMTVLPCSRHRDTEDLEKMIGFLQA